MTVPELAEPIRRAVGAVTVLVSQPSSKAHAKPEAKAKDAPEADAEPEPAPSKDDAEDPSDSSD